MTSSDASWPKHHARHHRPRETQGSGQNTLALVEWPAIVLTLPKKVVRPATPGLLDGGRTHVDHVVYPQPARPTLKFVPGPATSGHSAWVPV